MLRGSARCLCLQRGFSGALKRSKGNVTTEFSKGCISLAEKSSLRQALSR